PSLSSTHISSSTIYTPSLHDSLPIYHYSMIFPLPLLGFAFLGRSLYTQLAWKNLQRLAAVLLGSAAVLVFAVNVHNTAVYLSHLDRKSTRLNSSHLGISYAVFCLKNK